MTYEFPKDLLNAQVELLQASTAYESFCQDLPWSVEPLPGWRKVSGKVGVPDEVRDASPGYSPAQKQQDAAYRKQLRDLAINVSIHEFWETLSADVVAARMALKQKAAAVIAESGGGESAAAA